MAKISEVVNLVTGYANFVHLKSSFEKEQENASRVAMYRPTKAHRQAFERICHGLHRPDKKFYLLSGSYGTGKSHLCLMTANVLSHSSGDPVISGFYENYSKLNPEKAKELKNIRKDGQYLVAICDYESGNNFEDVVLKAVFEACEKKELDVEVETRFDEAERRLADWEEQGDKGGIRNFYEDFKKALETVDPSVSVQQLRRGLQDYNSQMLEKFRDAFRHMMGGVEFQTQSGNLIPIIKKLVRSPAFKERFRGLAIFFDEFGFTLENGRYSKDVLQGFMESICQNEPNVMFVGCIHKDFQSYADRLSKDDAAVMSARITQVDLLNEGIEDIIGAIVETKKDSGLWKKEIEPRVGIFDQFLPVCKRLDLFPWIEDVNRVRERVLEDIYGVHPIALSCLLKLSSEIGSDARSAFTFFSGDVAEQKDSYKDFIDHTEIVHSSGKLNLYTVDRLFEFFARELAQNNTELRESHRKAVSGYYASVDAFKKSIKDQLIGFQDDERLRVLKLILIYQLSGIPANSENVKFGMYALDRTEEKKITEYLDELSKTGALFYRRQSETYELASTGGEDPYDLIDRFMNDTNLHPNDVVSDALEESYFKNVPDFLYAKNYNGQFTEDKRFNIRFARANEIGNELLQEIRNDFVNSQRMPDKSYEGTVIYALCEDSTDIRTARDAARNIPDKNIITVVPHEPLPFTEDLLKAKACRYYLHPERSGKLSAQTESRLRDLLENKQDGYQPKLKKIFDDILEGQNSCWYGENGRIIVDSPKQKYLAVDTLCYELYTRRCQIPHQDLNLAHDDKWKPGRAGRNTALKQAVDILLEAEEVLIDNGNPNNHGDKRYLNRVLLKAGALKRTRSEGTNTFFVCDVNPENIHENFPVLKELCTRLAKLKDGEQLQLGAFIDEIRKPPYGAGVTQIFLALSHVIRGYGERLIAYKDSTMSEKQYIKNYDDLVDLVSNPSIQTVLVVKNINEAQFALADHFAKAVGASPLRHGENRSVSSTYDEITSWWNNLPAVSKILSLYENNGNSGRLAKLKSTLEDISSTTDKFDFVLNQLPSVYADNFSAGSLTINKTEKIGKEFEEDVKLFNSGEERAIKLVAENVCHVFGTTGDIVSCEKAVRAWYTSLSARQRDKNAYSSDEAISLLDCLSSDSSTFREIITNYLPKEYGFERISDWTNLRVKDYVAKIRLARDEIDKVRPFVYKPAVEKEVLELKETDEKYLELPQGTSGLIYTTDGEDPANNENAKHSADKLNLVELLKGKPGVNLKIRSVDPEGNYSDPVSVQLISKERKHDVQITKELFGHTAKFRWPDSREGLVEVIKSIIEDGQKKNLLSPEDGKMIEDVLDRLNKG